ncbi:response regulator [uncultured Microscilla sp.]|uniref:response regulator n=1 Tax=uncultured Microscilla sp. TaxID=432653 RepID=UPI00261C88FB|nr:response regulator [uncultured Microscilla sp.]
MMKQPESKVLLVDDDQQNLKSLLNLLRQKKDKYEPLTAPNGQVALQILRQTVPDLIITDWAMPQVSGLGLIKTVRQTPHLAHIPAIIVTGVNTTPENLQEAFDAGANDYLTKPLNPVELYARTDAALQMYYAMCTIRQQRQTIEDQKNRELSTKAIEIAQKNRLLEDVGKVVQEAVLQLEAGSVKQSLRQVIKTIRGNLYFNNEWDAFKLHFEQVHPHFFASLQQQFASLTLADLRHCAYIKIGLSNREVAQIMNISPESVVKQHYRIKKKMGVASKQTLGEIVMQAV